MATQNYDRPGAKTLNRAYVPGLIAGAQRRKPKPKPKQKRKTP